MDSYENGIKYKCFSYVPLLALRIFRN